LRSPGAPAPDLRESQIALRDEDLWSVVHDGAANKSARSMPISVLERERRWTCASRKPDRLRDMR
jgi:hypothetical protein